MKAESIWVRDYRFVLDNGRNHSIVVDLPKERGGKNSGPTPSELTIMGLAGCLSITFKIVADKRRLSYKTIKVNLNAERLANAKTITKVNGLLEVHTDADEREVETTFKIALENCPISRFFRKAGVEMNIKLSKKKG